MGSSFILPRDNFWWLLRFSPLHHMKLNSIISQTQARNSVKLKIYTMRDEIEIEFKMNCALKLCEYISCYVLWFTKSHKNQCQSGINLMNFFIKVLAVLTYRNGLKIHQNILIYLPCNLDNNICNNSICLHLYIYIYI